MILKEELDLIKSINECRLEMYELASNKGFSEPEVIKISHQLDRKIIMLQKMMYAIRP